MSVLRANKKATTEVIAELMADHKRVEKLFRAFEKAEDDQAEQSRIATEVCRELKIHATLEEEVFYPAVRGFLKKADDDCMMDEAEIEHGSIRSLIDKLEALRPGEQFYDGTMCVLSEYVKHHVKEEEGEMFPAVKRSRADLSDLQAAMARRKAELIAEFGGRPDARKEARASRTTSGRTIAAAGKTPQRRGRAMSAY